MEPQVCVPTPFTGDKNMNFNQGTSIYSDIDHEVFLLHNQKAPYFLMQ